PSPPEDLMTSTNPSVDHALAYPEPPASPMWHRGGPKARPLTPEERQRNQDLLRLAYRPRKTAA
ncbi:hypothetical protein, partial [Streptomyces sp. NPDC127574]|uniref:hypothetical protein n=2 Tax=Streptomyces TaxID=1883 RepID=UPI00363A1CC4